MLVVRSPDRLGLLGAEFGELALGYRWASGDPAPGFPRVGLLRSSNRRSRAHHDLASRHSLVELLECLGPVAAEQTRQRPVRQ